MSRMADVIVPHEDDDDKMNSDVETNNNNSGLADQSPNTKSGLESTNRVGHDDRSIVQPRSPPVRRERLTSNYIEDEEELLEVEKDLAVIHSYTCSGNEEDETSLVFENRSTVIEQTSAEPTMEATNTYFSPFTSHYDQPSQSDIHATDECEIPAIHQVYHRKSEQEGSQFLNLETHLTIQYPNIKTTVQPVVSIEITAPDDDGHAPSEDEDSTLSTIETNEVFEGSQYRNRAQPSVNLNKNKILTSGLNIGNNLHQRSVSSEDVSRSRKSKRKKVANFISRIRTRSQGDNEKGKDRSRSTSITSETSDFGVQAQYDSNSSLSKVGWDTSPVINVRLVSEYQAKQRTKMLEDGKLQKRKKNKDQHKSSSSQFYIYLDKPGESNDYTQHSLINQSKYSKSDSRLNVKLEEKRGFRNNRVVQKLKALRSKKDGNAQGLAGDLADVDVVAFSPDPYSYEYQGLTPINSKTINVQEVYHPLSDSNNQNNLNFNARRRSSTPNIMLHGSTIHDDTASPINLVENYYDNVESIYDETPPKQEHHRSRLMLDALWRTFR